MSVASRLAAWARGRRAPLPSPREHVGLGDAPAGPGAVTFARSTPSTGGDAAGDRRDLDAVGRTSAAGAGCGVRARARALGRGRLRSAVAAPAPGALMRATTWPTVTVSPTSASISVIAPRGGGGQLGVDLVGRDLDDALVGLDGVAGLLEPLEDHALGDRLAHGRDRDVDRSRPPASASALGSPARCLRRSAGAPPFGGDLASTAPTATVSPSAAWILTTVPRDGRGDLGVDLVGRDLDERLVGGDLSPSCLSHSRTVPSVTESPIAGMTTSTVVSTAIWASQDTFSTACRCGLVRADAALLQVETDRCPRTARRRPRRRPSRRARAGSRGAGRPPGTAAT